MSGTFEIGKDVSLAGHEVRYWSAKSCRGERRRSKGCGATGVFGIVADPTCSCIAGDLRPHIITIGNNGQLYCGGQYGTTESDVQRIFEQDFPRITAGWPKRRLLLYAHGGLVPDGEALQWLANFLPVLLAHHIYPVSFVWRTDFWSAVHYLLDGILRRFGPKGFLEIEGRALRNACNGESWASLFPERHLGYENAGPAIACSHPAASADHIGSRTLTLMPNVRGAVAHIVGETLLHDHWEHLVQASKESVFASLDAAVELLARFGGGKALWQEVRENGLLATQSLFGGARYAARRIRRLYRAAPDIEIHFIGHSAGSIFHAPLVQLLCTRGPIANGPLDHHQGFGLPVKTCTLWAPAITVKLFQETYLPCIETGAIGQFAMFTLTDYGERKDNCKRIYHKSLLYLISNSGEEIAHIPILRPDGEPLLGMEKYIEKNRNIKQLFTSGRADWVLAPNTERPGSPRASRATRHEDFDDDTVTIAATLTRILGHPPSLGRAIPFRRYAN